MNRDDQVLIDLKELKGLNYNHCNWCFAIQLKMRRKFLDIILKEKGAFRLIEEGMTAKHRQSASTSY